MNEIIANATATIIMRDYAITVPRKIVRSKQIVVRFDLEGVHHFPNAEQILGEFKTPDQDVKFLEYPHRHKFFFEIKIDVSGDNREIEFFQFQRKMKSEIVQFYNGNPSLQFGARSCEMICQEVIDLVLMHYPNYKGTLQVGVFEDNENGSEVTVIAQ